MRSTLAEFFDDRVIYRSLDPLDPQLPRYAELALRVGLPPDVPPRKCQPGYARAAAEHLRAAAHHAGIGDPERILFVGDTRGNDVTAFGQLVEETGWPGVAFIGRDDIETPPSWESDTTEERVVLYASRWHLLDELDAFCEALRFPIDERTTVLVDIDKTAIGARGRNDVAIDRARIDAVERTLSAFTGEAPPWDACRRLYNRLNRPSLHRLTADNQDIVATLCVLVVAGAVSPELPLRDDVAQCYASLDELLAETDSRGDRLPDEVTQLSRRFRAGVAHGVPPEFREFRRHEYAATVDRMNLLPDDAPLEERLQDEITITAEVRRAALRWADRGALVLGLSDKPDAASLPDEAMAAAGRLPLHRTEARVVGGVD